MPPDVARVVAETLSIKLKEPHYACADDAIDMIDLDAQPTLDLVRRILQKSMTYFKTKDIRETLLEMSSSGMLHHCSLLSSCYASCW